MRTLIVRASVMTAMLAAVVGIGASAASAVTVHQYPGQFPDYTYGGCPPGYYNSGGTCVPSNGGNTNQFGCPSGTFYNGAQCVPTRYDSYPNACPGGYYFDGYACTFAGANRPGPAVTPTPLPRPFYVDYATPAPVYSPPPPRVQHVSQTLPFTGAATVRISALGLSLLLGGLLLLSARSVAGIRRAV